VATIQLGQEMLAVEQLIDDGSRDEAAAKLHQLRERIGRRPEFKYLQALSDAVGQARPDRELLREVNALVAEQPDFTEASALLAFLYHRAGDSPKAEVFAREALRSPNPRAIARARRVLGIDPNAPIEPLSGSQPRMQPVYAPSASPSSPPDRERSRTRSMGSSELTPGAPQAEAASRGLTPQPFPGTGATHSSQPELPAVETITFSPSGDLPHPPSIPPSAMILGEGDRLDVGHEPAPPGMRENPTLPGFSQVQAPQIPNAGRAPTPAAMRAPTPHPGVAALGLKPRESSRPPAPDRVMLEHSVEHTGPESWAHMRASRPAMAIPPPVEVQRHWFKYARQHQVSSGPGESTSLTLLDLAERVLEGRTPLSSEPVPLDRRGLILVEQRLEQFRGNSGSVSPAERAVTTSAAAFLLAVLMKESEARAVDTAPEDGACKAVLPSGASVRPLLIAGSFARGRGPGIVESFDRAATAHMQRTQRPGPTSMRAPTQDAVPHPGPSPSMRAATRRTALTVPRRDLDAGTLALLDPGAPMGAAPTVNLRAIAEEFWISPEGQEVAGASRRVGAFSLADIDALERHATRTLSLVGMWPPGLPWPWTPTDGQERQILVWGAVLGEVLNSLYAGRWEADPSDPREQQLYRVVLSSSVMAWPMAKVYLRLARGVAHDLSIYVDVVGRIVGRQATRGM
jgi:hypothetical protein